MRRSLVLLTGAVIVAGGAALIGGDERAPSASIEGDPLVASAPITQPSQSPAASPAEAAREIAAYEGLAEKPAKRAVPPAPGTGPLGSLIDLDHIERIGDHYEAPLKDGRRAVLTLDPDLQTLAEKLLDESRAPRGGIVVMSPDGRILALAGRRTEDPMGSREGTFDWRLATDVWAPAASVFKLVTATALVGAGVSGDDKVCYHGGVRSVMESNLADSKRDSRCETLSYGVAHSNNAILGKLAFQNLVPDTLDSAARTLGFGPATAAAALPGTELPGNYGTVAIPTTHDLSFAKTAAGFSGVQLSVAGGALLTATFATGGEQPVPRLIASIDGIAHTGGKPRRILPKETARAVAKMMVATCSSGSAAKSFRKRDTSVAGKTGTLSRKEPFFMEHSWFVGFAPAEAPEVIVSVLLGNPESWHLRGHEAAKRLIDRALAASRREKDRTASVEPAARKQW